MIFELYASPLYNYALRLCADPLLADHIVGDVFAKLLEQFAAGKGPRSNLRSYPYEMAYHLIIDERRPASRWAPLEVLGPEAGPASGHFEDKIMLEKILGKDVSHIKVIQTRAMAKLRRVFAYNEIRRAVPTPGVGELSKTLGV